MDDFLTLVQRGVIYDGCPIVAKGTVRIKGNEVSIESMHNLMALDGKNFAELCEPKGRTEQGQLTSKDAEGFEDWREKAEELQEKLQQELNLRASIEEHLAREKKISEEATKVIHEANSKLAAKVEEVETLQSKLEDREGYVKDLEGRLESEGQLLAERGQKIQSLLNERDKTEETKEKKAELQEQLDSTFMILGEKEEKLQTLQGMLGKKEEVLKENIGRAKDAQVAAEQLKGQVALLEAEKMEDKKNEAIMLDDFSEWRTTAEDEINFLKKEIEHYKTTITTLKNELEISELEESEFQATLTSLQKENDHLRNELKLAARPPQEPEPERVSRKLKTQQSLKNLLRSVSVSGKSKESKEKKEKKDKRNSVASLPSV